MRTLLVTLITTTATLDLELSAEVPLTKLLPVILAACRALTGDSTFQSTADWKLFGDQTEPLLMARSLTEQGIRDGQRLRLLAEQVASHDNSFTPDTIATRKDFD